MVHSKKVVLKVHENSNNGQKSIMLPAELVDIPGELTLNYNTGTRVILQIS